MTERDRKGRGAFFGFVWLALAALAFAYLRVMGVQPRTFLAWMLVIVVGPAIMILPYALAENVMARVGIPRGEPVRGPRRILHPRRALLMFLALVLTVLGLAALTWLATGPLATLLRPLAPLARQHFEAVR